MNPILIERTRGALVESFHRGAICLVNSTGQVILEIGVINLLTFTRSALKLFQAIPLVESGAADGLKLSESEIAITCGSHNAEKEHLTAVNGILEKINVNSSFLKCGAQMPTGRLPRNEIRATGSNPTHIHNNCSGKHAGFLALCKHLDLNTEGYLEETHESQILIKEVVAEMLELKPTDLVLGEDGCSAPNYAASIYHQAIGYKNLVADTHSDKRNKTCLRIIEACIKQPLMIAGRDRYCTDIISATKGEVIGKTGADGVFCMAFPKLKMGCAIKIDDGKMGPQYKVAQAIVDSLGISISEDLSKYQETAVKNWNKHTVGVERISEFFQDKLGL